MLLGYWSAILSLLQALDRCLELCFEELGRSKYLCSFAFDEHQALNYIFVSYNLESWCFFIYRPEKDDVIGGAACECFGVGGCDDLAHPVLMTLECTAAETCCDLPQLNALVAGAADYALIIQDKRRPRYRVVVSVEGLGTLILVQLPELDSEVAGARHQELASVVKVNAGDGT